jgi:hypothetical protein
MSICNRTGGIVMSSANWFLLAFLVQQLFFAWTWKKPGFLNVIARTWFVASSVFLALMLIS